MPQAFLTAASHQAVAPGSSPGPCRIWAPSAPAGHGGCAGSLGRVSSYKALGRGEGRGMRLKGSRWRCSGLFSASQGAPAEYCLLQWAFVRDKACFCRDCPSELQLPRKRCLWFHYRLLLFQTQRQSSQLSAGFSASFLVKKGLWRLIAFSLRKAGIICRLLIEQGCSSSWYQGILFKFSLVHSVANSLCLSHMNHWINMNLKLRISLEL